MNTEYLYSFKIPPYKILVHYKRKKSNTVVEKPGRHQLNTMTRVNITNEKAQGPHVPPEMMQRDGHSVTSVEPPPQ